MPEVKHLSIKHVFPKKTINVVVAIVLSIQTNNNFANILKSLPTTSKKPRGKTSKLNERVKAHKIKNTHTDDSSN
jgi:hypothetical protein